MYGNAGVLCCHFHSLTLCPLATCNRLNAARLQWNITPSTILGCMNTVHTLGFHSFMDDYVLLSSPSKQFRSSRQPWLTCHSGTVAGIWVCTGGKQDAEGERELRREETKWQEACSASMNSDWRADGPIGVEVVLLSVHSEY